MPRTALHSEPDPPAGRSAEAEQLLGWAVGPARSGLFVVRGALGMGKSTLVRWLAARLRAEDWLVLATRATTPMLEPPLGVWTRLLAQSARRVGDGPASPDAAVDTGGSPPGSTRPRPPGAAGDLDLAAETLVEQFVRLGPHPTLLVIDDAHGMDEASLRLLVQLGPLLEHQPIRVVLTLPGTSVEHSEVHAALLAQVVASADHLELSELDAAGIAEVVTVLVGDPGVRSWAQRVSGRLIELGGGTPLLLGALVHDLRLPDGARPDLAELDGRPLRSTRQAIRARLLGLAPSVRAVLEAVALAEGRADPALVGAVTGREVGTALAAAEDAGFLERSGSVLRLTLPAYAEELRASASDASRLHAQLGAALLDAPRDRADAVHALRHLVAAGTAADPALRERAAQRVLADTGSSWEPVWARVEAEALEALWRPQVPAEPGWATLGLRVADAWFRAGNRPRSWAIAEEVLDAAPSHDPDLLIDAALAAGRGRDYAWSVYATGRRLLDVARHCGDEHPRSPLLVARAAELLLAQPELGVVPDAGSASATRPVTSWALDESGAAPLIERALAALSPDAPVEVAAEVRRLAAVVLRAPEQLDVRLGHARWALEHATTPEQRGLAAARLVTVEFEHGERRAAERALTELTTVSRTTGDPGLRWREHTLRAMLALASGRPQAAAEHRDRAFLAGQQVDEPGRWIARLVQTAFGDYEHRVEVSLPAVPDEEFAGWHPLMLAGRCWLEHRLAAGLPPALVRERQARASRAARAWSLPVLVGQAEEHAQRSYLPLYVSFLADAVGVAGDVASAERLLGTLTALRGRVAVHADGFYGHGSTARGLAVLLAVLGRHEEADDAAAEARRMDTTAGLTLSLLQGELDELLRARTRASRPEPEVRDGLRELAAHAAERGLARLAADARRAVDPALRAELRDRDLDVLSMIAEDATNAEIARQLGFSVSTIRKDTIRLFRLLEVTNRREAVEVARERGLIA